MGDLYTKPMAKSASLRRGLSPTIWSQAPLTEINNGGLTEGFGFVNDFLSYEADFLLAQDGSQGAVLMDTAAKGGVLLLDSAGTTDNQGPDLQMGGTAAASSFIASSVSKIYYEARIKIVDTLAAAQLFVGLGAVLTPFIDSDANASPNHIGFEAFSSTSATFASEKAGTRTSTSAAATLAEDTYIKLGLKIDGLTKVTPYVNGVAGTAITTNIPIVEVTPTFAIRSTGSTDPIMHIDWLACYQVEQIAN